jgi:glucosylceramidase
MEIGATRRLAGRARLLLLMVIAVACSAQEARLYVTSQAGDRIAPKPQRRFTNAAAGGPVFRIDDTVQDQEITGFGASFLEAGMICLNSLDSSHQEEVLQALFDPEKGAGFTAMKTVIGATDFQSAGPYYTYDDHPGDTGMKLFSIRRDLGPNGLVTYIRRARRYGQFVLQAPMDYPPDWMLFDANKNQDVDPKYFGPLALYYLRYLQEYEKQGIFIDYLSLFNEPGIYTNIGTNKIRDLLKNNVGPLLEKEGVRTKIQPSEFNTRERAFKNFPIILDDPGARKYAGALAYHGYEFKDLDKLAALHRRYPDLKLWMTEVDHSYGTDTPRSVVLPMRDYDDGDFWGNQIMNDLESGTSAWIYWNMILDEIGGPWLVSPVHRDTDGNQQHPVVIIDRKKKEVIYTGLYYYLAHFSRFVRPGAVRVETGRSSSRAFGGGAFPKVRCVAFKGKEGEIVAEVLNSGKQSTAVVLQWRGRFLNVDLPARSITTCLW